LAALARARNGNAAVLLQGVAASQTEWIEEAVAEIPGIVGVVLPPSASPGDVKGLVDKLGKSVPFFAEIEAGGDIYDPKFGEAAARRFTEIVSAGGFTCVTMSGEGGLTDYHDDPGAAYYALRALATALDGGRPGGGDLLTLETDSPGARKLGLLGDGGDLMVAVWDLASVGGGGKPATLSAKGSYSRAVIVDPMTSTVAEADVSESNGESTVRGIELRPYPLVVRFEA
jgi:hypothetical protein